MNFEREDTKQKVVKIIADKLSMKPDQIKEESTFKDLGADSLDTLEMIMFFEDTFETEIDDNEAQKILTVKEAIDSVHEIRQK